MINFKLHTLVPRLLVQAWAVIRKILAFPDKGSVHKVNPECPGRATSGFFMRSHYRSPTLLAEQANCKLQPYRLLDQVNSPIWTQRKFPSGAFLSLFFAGFFSLSLNMNQSTTQL